MILKIIIGLIILTIIVLMGVGFGMMCYVILPARPSVEETEKIERDKGLLEFYDSMTKESMNVVSYDGYLLHGVLIKNNSDKYVIITHGWQYNRNGSIKYANIFYKLGYNIYIYDLRHFGDNQKCFCSMGKYESKDIIAVQEALYNRFGNDIKIGLHGESLGCASSILALGMSQKFIFCVADCGFADLKKLFVDLTKNAFHMPVAVTYTANLWLKVIHHYSFFDIRPVDALKENKVPVLFIHGSQDDFISPEHSRINYAADTGEKNLYIAEGAGHAGSYFSNPKEYEDCVVKFLRDIGA